jgi:hypothetical protein
MPRPHRQSRNAEVDFRGKKRSNSTHASTSDPDAWLYKKSPGTGAMLCFIGHALMENRSGVIVQGDLTRADGRAERRAAINMIDRHSPGSTRRLTVGADKGFDTADFVTEMRRACVDELEISGGRRPYRVRTLRPGQSIPVFQGLWEFVPYNDPATQPTDPYGFAVIVEGYRKDLLAGDDDVRDQALKDLRKHYEATFGRGAMNNVSLMLYGGAVGPWHQVRYSEKQYLQFCQVSCQSDRHVQNAKGAILLTGDGVLNAAKKWDDLEDYLDAKRVTRTAVFQVAHHGARANWYHGLAVRAVPRTSVFSSDPAHSYGHPHAEVLRDFWSFHPVQVDQHSGFSTHIVLDQ